MQHPEGRLGARQGCATAPVHSAAPQNCRSAPGLSTPPARPPYRRPASSRPLVVPVARSPLRRAPRAFVMRPIVAEGAGRVKRHRLASILKGSPRRNEEREGYLYKFCSSRCIIRSSFSYQQARVAALILSMKSWLPAVVDGNLACRLWPPLTAHGALLFFGDAARFAPMGQPRLYLGACGPATGREDDGAAQGYKVWGLVDRFSGRLFWAGQSEALHGQELLRVFGHGL